VAFAGCFSPDGLDPELVAELGETGAAWSDDRVHLVVATGSTAAADRSSGRVALFRGRLDNRRELQGRLGAHAVLLELDTDAAYVLAAHREWGASGFRELVGDFATAIWSPTQSTLLLARDPLGVQPLSYAWRGTDLVFAGELEQLLALPSISNEVDDDSALSYLYALPSPPPSFYREIRPVPAGHVLEVTPSSFRIDRYWHWPERPSEQWVSAPDATAQFRGLLDESIRTRLAGGRRTAIFLSGGLDSSGIAALAGTVARADGLEIPRAYSRIYDRFRSCDEREYARAVVARNRLPHTELSADSWWTLSHFKEWLPRFSEPFFGSYDDGIRRMLERASADGAQLALTGHGGDDLFTGSPRYLARWLLRGHVRPVWRELSAQSLERGRSRRYSFAADVALPLVPRAVQARVRTRPYVRLRSWMPPQVRAGLGESAGRREVRFGPDAWWYELRDGLASESHGRFHAHLQRLTGLFGLETTVPYLDVRLVTFVLGLPPELLQREGRTKAILRDGLRDVLPPAVLERPDKTSLLPLAEYGLREQRGGVLRKLARDSELERRGFVAGPRWRQAVDDFVAGAAVPLWRSLTLELWLRHRVSRLPEELLGG